MATVLTKYGEMDERELVKFEYPRHDGTWITDYYYHKELVHRSATVRLTGVQGSGVAQQI